MCQFIKLGDRFIKHPVNTHIIYNLPIINNMCKKIKETYPNQTVALWCTGSSGVIIAGIIASKLRRKSTMINYIRKEKESAHCGETITGHGAINIIVDDFIALGGTLNNILNTMKKFNVEPDCLCVSGYVSKRFTDNFKTVICDEV